MKRQNILALVSAFDKNWTIDLVHLGTSKCVIAGIIRAKCQCAGGEKNQEKEGEEGSGGEGGKHGVVAYSLCAFINSENEPSVV